MTSTEDRMWQYPEVLAQLTLGERIALAADHQFKEEAPGPRPLLSGPTGKPQSGSHHRFPWRRLVPAAMFWTLQRRRVGL